MHQRIVHKDVEQMQINKMIDWSYDLVAYTIGVGVGLIFEFILQRK